MIDPHDPLSRLFRSARQAPERAIELPAGFECRVLQAWRHANLEEDATWVLAQLRRAILIACAVAFLSVAFSYTPAGESNLNELAQADLSIETSLLP